MTLLKISDIRARANQEPAIRLFKRTATMVLNDLAESKKEAFEEEEKGRNSYNIFLSHNSDAELVLGAKLTLEDYGYSVYVNWNEEHMDLTKESAATLRICMECSKILLFLTTESKIDWVPWECAYMDGRKGRTGILPLSDTERDSFMGAGFLGLYPYIMSSQDSEGLFLHETQKTFCTLTAWLNGLKPTMGNKDQVRSVSRDRN